MTRVKNQFRGVPLPDFRRYRAVIAASAPNPHQHVSPAERYRIRSGLSQAEASLKSGVDQRTLRYVEHAEREPRMPVVRRLAALYKVDPADLLDEIRSYMSERERAA